MWNATIRCDLNATAGQRPALPDQPQSRAPEPKCTSRVRERGPLARTFAITTRDCEHITPISCCANRITHHILAGEPPALPVERCRLGPRDLAAWKSPALPDGRLKVARAPKIVRHTKTPRPITPHIYLCFLVLNNHFIRTNMPC